MFERLGHLLCFVLPCTTLLFLTGGPYDSGAALAWTLPLWLLVIADWLSPKIDPLRGYPAFTDHYFSGILYSLAVMQLCNIGLMLDYVSRLQWHTQEQIITGLVNLIAARILVGTSSGSSGFIVAHELLHRKRPWIILFGNLLLCSMCYQHFAVAHLRGHHRNVTEPDDITTARRGESFNNYWKRVFIEHFRFAWQVELKRLKIVDHPYHFPILLKNRVLLGLLSELMLILSFIFVFGWIAALLFLYQSFTAVRLLEAINYFQHWGLITRSKGAALAWVNDSWVTRNALLNLSCHIDHHRSAAKHFQQLHYSGHGPKMPQGYFVTNLWVKLHNRSYRKKAIRELKNYRIPQPAPAPSIPAVMQQ